MRENVRDSRAIPPRSRVFTQSRAPFHPGSYSIHRDGVLPIFGDQSSSGYDNSCPLIVLALLPLQPASEGLHLQCTSATHTNLCQFFSWGYTTIWPHCATLPGAVSNMCVQAIQPYPLSSSCSISFIFSSCCRMWRWTEADALTYLPGLVPRRFLPVVASGEESRRGEC